MSYEMKKVSMQDGNEMIPANERIKFLKESGIDYDWDEKFEELAGGKAVKCFVVLVIHLAGGVDRFYPGVCVEHITQEPYNDNSAWETAETKAKGRACGAFGIGIDDSYASYDEVISKLGKHFPIDPDPDEQSAITKELQDSVNRGAAATTNAEKRVNKRSQSSVKPKEEVKEEPSVEEVKQESAEEEELSAPGNPEPPAAEMVDDPFAKKEEKAKAKEYPTPNERKSNKEILAEKAAGATVKENQTAKDLPYQTNRHGIEIPQLGDKGERGWSVVMKISEQMEEHQLGLDALRESFIKLFPGYKDFDESDILMKATVEELNKCLDTLGK